MVFWESVDGLFCMKLPKIGQGIGEYQWSDEHANIIRRGIDLGMTLLDTCESYNDGMSEKVVGKAVKGVRDKVSILTKFNAVNSDFNSVMESVEGSLKRLGTDYIDIYQMHWPSTTIPYSETFDAMLKLLDSGKVLSIGVGNALNIKDLEDIYKSSKGRITSYQTEYNLFDRWAEEEFFPYCSDKNIQVISYSPLDRGRMSNGTYQLDTLKKIADRYGVLVSQVVLNWMSTKHNIIPIPKATNTKHLISNSESLSFKLDSADIDVIDATCVTRILKIDPLKIKVSLNGQDNRKVYTTLQEAIDNNFKLSPSPKELSEKINGDDEIKPVRVLKTGEDEYELVEGRVRYWAWVMANNKNISVLVRENF